MGEMGRGVRAAARPEAMCLGRAWAGMLASGLPLA